MADGRYSRFTRPGLSETSGVAPIAEEWFFGAQSAVNHSLGGESGSYAVTGKAAGFQVSRTLSGAAGAYSLTGRVGSFNVGRSLTGASGSYTVTGQAATLTHTTGGAAYSLSGEAGAYVVTGFDGAFAVTVGTVTHAAQPKRRRLKWREFENLPRLDEPQEEAKQYAGPNLLADTAEQALALESRRLTSLLAAAKIEQENARQRAQAAEIAQEIEAVRIAMADMVAAAKEAERIAQEIEEIDVAYIVATLLND